VLDDVDGLYRDRNGIRLLKTLCQTEPVKTLSWHTDAPTLEKRGIPRQFTTTSRMAVIANQWQSLNADVAALEDRGHVLIFEPTALEIHRQASTWFWDQEIFDFVGRWLHLMKQPSLRPHVQAWELKTAALDWQTGILGRCLVLWGLRPGLTETALEAELQIGKFFRRSSLIARAASCGR
jgi:hypothetical protein